jgi:hypothetical protein
MEKEHEGGGEGGSLSALRLPGSPGSPLKGEERKSPQSPAILNALGGEDMVEKVGATGDHFGRFRGGRHEKGARRDVGPLGPPCEGRKAHCGGSKEAVPVSCDLDFDSVGIDMIQKVGEKEQ